MSHPDALSSLRALAEAARDTNAAGEFYASDANDSAFTADGYAEAIQAHRVALSAFRVVATFDVILSLLSALSESETERARLAAENETLRVEVATWQWLHWSHPESQWACACGDVLGRHVVKCDKCGATKPTLPADAVERHRLRALNVRASRSTTEEKT